MRISTIKFFIQESFRNLKRNKTMSIAAITTVAATLFILGISLLTLTTIRQGILQVESKVEVKVYLKDDITSKQKDAIKNKIESIDGIVNLDYETKQEAVDKFKTQLGEQNESLVEGLKKDNPLPNSYIVKVKTPEIVSQVVNSIKGMDGIDTIQDARGVVDKIIKITNAIKWIGTIVLIILIGVSLFLIGNTIKITVYSRRKEIGIMKYIGATDWFIRWPFIIEGIVIGIIGAIVSDIVLYYMYKIVYVKASYAPLLMCFVNPQYVYTHILGIFILSGSIIGAVGSILSIRKFLAV
ncbi:permease-like cell division protein FtsX [Clostridium sp.]|jgi:cell division transport system permease protein|uniref:permease-like cell division protein FtsX n=1 Tax=Clostridium sp. TaxID=1506 RepID=UPI003A5B95EB